MPLTLTCNESLPWIYNANYSGKHQFATLLSKFNEVMEEARLVKYDNAEEFLQVMQPLDDCGMNFALGPVYDRLDSVLPPEVGDQTKGIFMAVWKGERVM